MRPAARIEPGALVTALKSGRPGKAAETSMRKNRPWKGTRTSSSRVVPPLSHAAKVCHSGSLRDFQCLPPAAFAGQDELFPDSEVRARLILAPCDRSPRPGRFARKIGCTRSLRFPHFRFFNKRYTLYPINPPTATPAPMTTLADSPVKTP